MSTITGEGHTNVNGRTREERVVTIGLGATVWITGLPAAGKTTLADAVERELLARGRAAYRIDGDEIRLGLCGDLGFDRESRAENVRRVAHVARLMADAGLVVIVSLISPYANDRAGARAIHDEVDLPFLEVFVDTPISVCESRDPKGLYARARRGEVKGLTGVDGDYEPPANPDLRLEPGSLERSVRAVCDALAGAGTLGS